MKPVKIVTHGGIFHADEISAIALIENVFGISCHEDIPLERVFKVTEEDLSDPNVWVLDIGGRYEPHLNNFDHHHDAELPACNVLMLEALSARGIINGKTAEHLFNNMFMYISNVDCGHIIEETTSKIPTVNSIIRACNAIGPTGFNIALDLMGDILMGQFAWADEAEKALTLWAMAEKRAGYAIHDSLEQIVGWQELAENENIRFLITPNARGGYQIMSRDSRQWPIPEDARQTFRHNSGFLAVYATKEDAIAHATELCAEKTQAQKFQADWGCDFDEGTMPVTRENMAANMAAAFEQSEIGLPVWGKEVPVLPEGATMTALDWDGDGNSATFTIFFADGSELDCTFND